MQIAPVITTIISKQSRGSWDNRHDIKRLKQSRPSRWFGKIWVVSWWLERSKHAYSWCLGMSRLRLATFDSNFWHFEQFFFSTSNFGQLLLFWATQFWANFDQIKGFQHARVNNFNRNLRFIWASRTGLRSLAQLGGEEGGKCPRPITLKLLMIMKWNLVE